MDKVFTIGRDPVPTFLRLGENEKARLTLIVPEGTSCKLSMEIDLDGAGADLDLAGAWRCTGEEQVQINVLVRHNVPGCTSNQLFKGVVGGKAKASFDGLVYVAEGAIHTVAHQQSHSLLVSKDASCEARPQLEIYADDVECTHGATNGYLNPDELFYMRCRGIPEEEARAMQVEAFLAPVYKRLEDES